MVWSNPPAWHEGGIAEGDFANYDETLLKVVNRELGLTSLPIVTRMDFGHTDPFFTIPYGVSAEIHCETGRLFVPQGTVT